MKILKIIGRLMMIVIFISIILFILSTIMYQRLVDDGQVVEDMQCFNVNPLIIQRKNSFVKYIKMLKDEDEGYLEEMENYMKLSKKYINAQSKQLQEIKKYMNRLDFKLIFPSKVKKLVKFLYISREADMNSVKTMIKLSETDDLNLQKKYSEEINNLIKIANEADKEIDKIQEEKLHDPFLLMRLKFIKIPPSKCPPENFNIPDVYDLLFNQEGEQEEEQINYGPVSYLFMI